MTRAELADRFRPDHADLRDRQTYSYRDCPSIKVLIHFEPAAVSDENSKNDWSRDKIVSVSKPFLD
jgi:hypothetical protein